jgi:hypothetical protein
MPESSGVSGERPRTASAPLQLTEDESEVLAFLRDTKRVDLRWLSDEQKLRIKTVLNRLHNEKKISLLRISKEVGRSYTAIWWLCRSLEIHTRTVAEADKESAASRSKHKRTPFAGSEEDGAYMLGFRNGDLTAWQVSGTAVMVTSSTTHPAFAELFQNLFREYSHVYQYPMFEEGKGYKWKLGVRLDNSFQFLLKSATEAVVEFAEKRSLLLSWLAGLIDSDGNIHAFQDSGSTRVRITIYNSNTELLNLIIKELRGIGYEFNGPYLLKEEGTVTPFGIRYTKDLWQIALQQTSSAQKLLVELPVRHSEKIYRKELAMRVGKMEWQIIDHELKQQKAKTKLDVLDFCREAEERFSQRHQKTFPAELRSAEP